MKNSVAYISLVILLILCACEKDNMDNLSAAEGGKKVDICHKGDIIRVSVNAIKAHRDHGDAIDMDDDGYFDLENTCTAGVDCDDLNATVYPDAPEICGDLLDNNCNDLIDEDCDTACETGCCWCDLLAGADLTDACVYFGTEEGITIGVISFTGADGEPDVLAVSDAYDGVCVNAADVDSPAEIGEAAAAECLAFVAAFVQTSGLPICEDIDVLDIFGFVGSDDQ